MKAVLKVIVHYNDEVDPDEAKDILHNAAEHLVDNGLLSGEFDLESVSIKVKIK